MKVDQIPNGANIELEVRYNQRTMSFRSEVVLVRDNAILIYPITVNGQTIGFNNNSQLDLIVKTDGKVYLWNDVIVKLIKYEGALYHKIHLYGEGKHYNRRDAYRMYIGEDMPIYINTASGPSALSVLVKDISETGVGFITKEELDIDRTIRLKIKDKYSFISLSAIIVRKEYLPHLDSYLYGCKFYEKNNRLGNFIARRQGEQLRNKANNYSSPLISTRKSNFRRR